MKKTTTIMVFFMTPLLFNLHASQPTEVNFRLDKSEIGVALSYTNKNRTAKSNTLTNGWDNELSSSKDLYVRTIRNVTNDLIYNWIKKTEFETLTLNSNGDGSSNENHEMVKETSDANLDEQLEDSLKIYPNPATSKFRIQGKKVDVIEMFNILGSKILEIRNTNTVNISNFNTGAYLVKITVNDTSVTKKLIISK